MALELRNQYMATDQYGTTVMIKRHPRKELLAHCDRQHASKMYITADDGHNYHIGYVIARRWFTITTLQPWGKIDQ